MKIFKLPTFISLTIIVIVLISASLLMERPVVAQQTGYPTPNEALEAALTEYLAVTATTESWELGTVFTSGGFGYSIAQTAENTDSMQDFVLLMTQQKEGGLWFYAAPEVTTADEYNQWLEATPDALIDPFSKAFYYQYIPQVLESFSVRSITLYRLPWPIREEAILTQKNGTYHVNQLDFVVRNTDDIYASKPGLVLYKKEVSDIGGCDMSLWPWANMVVVMHSLTEYSWYVHLKQNSVPVEVGDLIGYGTKLGEQGNTGFACGATGIHLHYMVSTEAPTSWPDPNVPNYAPWPPGGSIVPVDFMEVSYAALSVGTYYESTNAPPPGICSSNPASLNIYDNTYCNSSLQSVTTTGLVDLGELEFAERIESIEIPQGWSVGLYREENELGPKVCLSQSDPMLWDNLFDNGEVVANRVSWMRVYQSAGCPYPFEQGIAFYPSANFIGTPTFGMIGERLSNGPSTPAGSIYIPGGYSARLFDQDDGTGNMICLSASVLDMGAVAGWMGVTIESVELVQGDVCAPAPVVVPQPVLIRPENSGIAYSEYPELCWQAGDYPDPLSFNVEITNPEGTFADASGWINDTCWSPSSLVGLTGDYSWKVQSKNSQGELSEWSVGFSFSLAEDQIAPLAAFRYLDDGSQVSWPRTNLFVNAADGETKVAKVHYFAWYDDGLGNGYDWHYIGVDEDETDDWNILWSVVDVASPDLALWIYAEDLGGNFTSNFITGLHISDAQTGDGGIEGRDSGNPRDGTGGEGEDQPPDIAGAEEDQPGETSSPPAEVEPGSTGSDDEPVETSPVRTAPSAPALTSPSDGKIYYRPDTIQLCWKSAPVGSVYHYQVELTGEKSITSPWLSSNCWHPEGLSELSGDYSWRVRARSDGDLTSSWSPVSAFELRQDQTPPEVVLFAPDLADLQKGILGIKFTSSDQESGLNELHLMAWFDAGDGYQWHLLGVLNRSDSDSYEYTWDVASLKNQRVQIWVYAVDNSGNVGFDKLEGIHIRGEDSPGGDARKAMPDRVGRAKDQP